MAEKVWYSAKSLAVLVEWWSNEFQPKFCCEIIVGDGLIVTVSNGNNNFTVYGMIYIQLTFNYLQIH